MPMNVTSRPNVNVKAGDAAKTEEITRGSLAKHAATGGAPASRGGAMGYPRRMDSPRERACPSCGAPAEGPQRWCLECGHELPGARRSALRPAVGIATTLAVLVGAASAGGYTLLRHDKPLPPPAQTVAQAPPATTAPGGLPPATASPAPYRSTPYVPPTTAGSGYAGGVPAYRPASPSRHATTRATTKNTTSDGSLQPTTQTTPAPTTPSKPQLALTDVALGAAAVVYAPYAPATVDLGDPSLTVDGSTATAWKAPALGAGAANPQLGVYVDLASRQKIRTLVLQTPTPGMNVEVYGATSGPPAAITDAGWDHLASRRDVKGKTKIGLGDRACRYVLVWIVGAPPNGARPAISELSLLSLQPE